MWHYLWKLALVLCFQTLILRDGQIRGADRDRLENSTLIDLSTANTFHLRIAGAVKNYPLTRVRYGGPLAEVGRIAIPKIDNGSESYCSWQVGYVEDSDAELEQIAFKIVVSLTKQETAVATCTIGRKVLYLSVQDLAIATSIDEPIKRLHGLSVRQLLTKIGTPSK